MKLRRCALAALIASQLGALPGAAQEAEEPLPENKTEPTADAPPPPPPLDFEAAMGRAVEGRSEEFARSLYAFCHDEDYDGRRSEDARAFCEVFDESTFEVCPNAKALCREEKPWWKFPDLAIPPWLAWLLIGLGALGLVAAFAQAFLRDGWESRSDLDLSASEAAAALDALQSLPEAPAMTILRRAARALEEGRAAEAAVLLQLAMLRYFDDRGLARFHPSKTNGDYLRALRRHGELRDLYRGVAGTTDRLRFGDGLVDASQLAGLVEGARVSLAREPSGEVKAASALLLCLAAASALPATGCGMSSKRFYDPAPDGFAAFPALLRRAGIEVTITRAPLDELPEDTGAVFFLTSATGARGVRKLSLDPVLDRGIAVVVADDHTDLQATAILPVTVTSTGVVPPAPAVDVALAPDGTCGLELPLLAMRIAPGVVRIPRSPVMRWNGETGASKVVELPLDLAPVLTAGGEARDEATNDLAKDEEDEAAMEAIAFAASRVDHEGEYLGGCLFLFSSAHLFTNASLTREANAELVAGMFASLLREGEKVVLLDALEAGAGAPAAGRTIGEARLLPMVAQLGLWAVALFISLGAAFGPLRDPVKRSHKAFSEHVQAVGRHYAASGTRGMTHAAHALARLLVMRHRHEVRGGELGGWLAVARHLAERYEVDERDVRAALRLGIEGTSELGTPGLDDPLPASERMLRTLSTLLGSHGKKRS